jgi:hypothetical protein
VSAAGRSGTQIEGVVLADGRRLLLFGWRWLFSDLFRAAAAGKNESEGESGYGCDR